MPDSRPEELIEAEKLIYKAKFDEALQLINEFEEKEALTPNDQLLVMLLKGRLYEYQRRPGKSVKIGEEAYQMSQKLGKVSETIDALLLKSLIVFFRSPDDALEPILEAEKLLNAHVEKPSSVLSRQKANILYRKSRIYYLKADSDHALEFALQCLALREKLGENLEISSSLLQIGFLLIIKGEYKKALDYIKRSLTLRRELNFKTGIAEILPQLALSYFNLGELDQALEICKQASSVKESNIEDKLFTLFVLVDIYSAKGELNRALKYCNQGVALAEENKIRRWLAPFQYRIGLTYALMGHPYRAKNYLVRCLTLSKEFNNFLFIVNTLGVLISISIFENSREQAQSYLKELKETVDQTGMDTDMYILSKSNLLATSGRRRDSAEAERLLRQLIDDKKTFSPVYIDALISLCSILLQELSMYNNPIVLDDINPLITQLLNLAEKQHSYRWLAEAKLLQAKLKLIQLDIPEAKQLLVQAQRIAELHGIQSLAHTISGEHDSLLEQINLWNSLKKRNAPMSERIKLAVFDEIIDRMQRKRAVEPPELIDEVPVMLLIVAEGGVPAFSNSFEEEWSSEDDIISSFLTAFNNFSKEVFSKGLDRAKFGEYLLVMDSIGPFSVCYLFKGQSYLAKQKLIHFAHRVQNTASIWGALKNFLKTNQVIEVSENPRLESLITEIFIKKNPGISTQI